MLGAIGKLGAVGNGVPLPRRVRAILNKYGATMLLPGVSGALRFGYQPGNYRESTGQTLAAADQQVGLVLDAAGSVGPELIPDGSFASGVGEWSEMTEPSSSVIDGELVVTRTTGFVGRQRTFSAVANKTYVIEGDVARSSGTGVPVLRVRTGSALSGVILADGIITAPAATMQRYRVVFQSTVTGVLYAQVAINTSSAVCRFDNISVRELPGIHASQSTSGFQPVLRDTSGIRSWQFDGVDDRLALSAVPFQMADDHFVVVGFRNDSKASLRAQFSVSGSDQTRIAQVYTSTNGGVRVVWRDGSGAVQNEVVSSLDVTGTAVVASGAKRIGRLIGRLDSAQFGDIASGAFGASNPVAASVGANTGVLGFFANGHIHGVIFSKGAITDSELLTLEKFVASLQGRTL